MFRWAVEHDRCIVTDNVKDFAPLARQVDESRQHGANLLFTSSRPSPDRAATLARSSRRSAPGSTPPARATRPPKTGYSSPPLKRDRWQPAHQALTRGRRRNVSPYL
ncbi:hypothetical protein [uncultured Jatrophihabitans sp.]|uniref:hypothetical protein n=1 Tax=uncultured Jatrophihabitans sp. TaxID=1610747 RepID=UPI0035C9E882